MQPSREHISYLFHQHLAGNLTPAQQQEFYSLVDAGENDPALKELMHQAWQQYIPSREAPENWSKVVFEEIVRNSTGQSVMPAHRLRFLKTTWLRYAAAVVLCLGAGAYLYFSKPVKISTLASQQSPVAIKDIPPGKTGALLTLADGSVVVLDNLKNGIIANQNGSAIVLNDGQLKYAASEETGEMAYNTITTPRGRQFHLVLPDGSKVWLNAASSITFPTAFSKKERNVKITGEAYFEIRGNKTSPFRVGIHGMQVDVLGTSFNVNAYEDEAVVKTTLMEGSIKVINNAENNAPLQLIPGQQAQLARNQLSVINDPDIEKVMAWKNGLFNFQDAPFEEVMRQLARWYNIKVEYENGVPEIEFEGKLGRDVSFSKMLVFFRESGIQFRIENGNTLVISKK